MRAKKKIEGLSKIESEEITARSSLIFDRSDEIIFELREKI